MDRALPRLYGVTDEALLPSAILVERVTEALAAGLRLVQVRFKTTPAADRLVLGRELRRATRAHGARLVVNDDPRLAAEIDADGVHVGADDVSVERAREILGDAAIVGMSAYGGADILARSADRGADYVGLSSPYPSPTKDKPSPTGEVFDRLAASSPVPAFAIGGITVERAADMIRRGCHGVAAVSSLFGVEEIAGTVARLLAAVGEVDRGPGDSGRGSGAISD